jgi:hypothetical protein
VTVKFQIVPLEAFELNSWSYRTPALEVALNQSAVATGQAAASVTTADKDGCALAQDVVVHRPERLILSAGFAHAPHRRLVSLNAYGSGLDRS